MRLTLGALTVVAAFSLLAAACRSGGGGDVESASPQPTQTPTPVPSQTPTPAPTEPVPSVELPELPEVESLDYLTYNVEVPPLPPFASRVDDAALAAVIQKAIGGYEGTFSVVVRNLEDGRTASLDGARIYDAASLFKVALLLEAYRQRDAGELDFGQLLTLTEEYVAYDFGTLGPLGLEEGDAVTLEDALKAMIIVSDTPTAVLVQDTVNPARVDATLRSLGLVDMSVAVFELPTTARDMVLLMEAVASGAGVTEGSRREMLALLLQESVRDRIPAGLPPGTAVAHKTGNLNNVTHDVALVWGPGGPYIIAVLSDRFYETTNIADLSTAVWDYFAKNP
jgi:beta-lactamase class A